MRNRNFKDVLKKSLLLMAIIFSASTLKAQLTGVKTIPGDYASLDLAITDLNTQGVGIGGVTFNLLAGNPQTAPAGGYVINTAGSLTDAIVFNGNANTITSSAALVAGQLNDGIIKIVGTDNVTIQNFVLQEDAANTTTAAATNNMTEWGIALLYASLTDGARNCSLIGNTIVLNRIYQNTFGIYSNSTHSATTIATSATATSFDGSNSGLIVHSNIINNVNLGIVVVGPTGAANNNDGIDIGGTSVSTGNTITNFGSTGTFSGFANVSGTVNGILVRNSKNINVSYNTLTSSIGGVTAGTLNGIQVPAFSNTPTGAFTQNINNNSISLNSGAVGGTINGINIAGTSASASSSININNNNFSAFDHDPAGATGSITFITQGGTHLNQSISNNTFTNISVKTTGSVTFISNSHSLPANGTKNVNGNNIVTAFNKLGAGGTVTLFTDNGSDPATAINNTNNNNFSNITVTGATTIAGFNNTNGGTPTKSVSNNTFSNWIGGTSQITGFTVSFSGNSTISNNIVSNITSAGPITGISSGSGIENFTGNTVHTLISTGASVVNGISNTGGTTKIFASNKIYNLEANNAGGSVNGILVTSGTTVTLQNNLIGDLRTPSSNAANPLNGINITGGTTVNAFYNTVNINGASSGALFGSSAISVSTTPNVTLRNNIFINESSFNGAAFAVAMRRSSATLTSYNNASNNNLFYAGTPSANNLILYDGTNSYGTLLAYQTAVLPRDVNSITGEAAFVGLGYATAGNFFTSLTGSSSDFLRPVAGITSQVESGATAIVGVTSDFAGITRPASGTNPDMGAFEFAGTSPAPVITLNSVTPSVAAQCVAADRLISVDVTTAAGTILTVNLGFTVNGVPQANIPMTNTSGSTWEATLPVQVPANALIAWGVSATNSIGLSSSFTGTTYSDEPLSGATASALTSETTICANESSNLSATLSKVGSSVSGLGSGTSSSSSLSPFYHGYGGVKSQYIYRASELTAMGFVAGNISSLSVNITSLGTATLNSFSINVGHTAQNAAVVNTAILSGLTEVYNAAAQTLTLGTNLYTFSTPFNWDGISNIVISFNYSNVNTGGLSSTVTTDPAVAFTSSLAIFADNAAASCLLTAPASGQVCMGTSSNSTSSVRPTMTFTGNKTLAITSVTWMDGMTTVGTGNPLTVNPTVTTTYTANISASGCTVSPSPSVTVTVNPLPTAPSATNSVQCGTQIPTASVTSTSGLPTPTFIWYDAAVAGTAMQNSTSTTYTSNVATTTTFYVAELNALTGCESARTAVTVTVAIADGITASADNATICIGSPVVLSVVNNNGTPNQTYSYTWTNADAGSGLVSQTGSSITVTPTLPGTYIYDVVGVDGGCSAVSSTSVTVNPFVATLSPINVSCNGYNNGSFSVASSSCGTMPYTYSVNGGGFGAIPTNLAPGTYAVVVQDDNNYLIASQNVTITEPSTTIANPITTGISVCEMETSAQVMASSNTNTSAPASQTVSFNVTAQPAESFAAPGNIVASATVPALPAGAIVTSLVINYNGITPNATGEWQSDVRLGLSGAYTNANAAGTGTTGFGTVIGVPFNYTRTINSPVGFPLTGGTINLTYHNDFNDATTTTDALFALGNVASLVINYTLPVPATITWWSAPSAGTQLGSGSPCETVGTSVLPNTNTPGVYTFYAQGEFAGCNGLTRTPVTVTVNSPSTSTTTITACTSYTWTNNTTYTVGGTYTQVLTNAVGCDSTATLVLTINQPTSSTVTVVACDSYTWAENGTTYTASGNYPVVLAGANAVGCDSTVTLNLTINNSTTSTTTVTACDSYTWTNTMTYTVGGTYTQVLTNAAGCDSTATLVLTINNSTTSTTTITACDSYTWTNGTTYTVGGTYSYVLTNAAGCDSTATLVLTINNSTASTTTVTACDSYTWTNTTTYTVGGTYTQMLTNAAGCDSTATLVLTINNSTASTTTITECDSYTWTNGTTYTVGGTYSYVLTNAAGCDSTATLVLTINNSTTGTDVQTACDSYTWIDGVTYTANNSTATFVLTNAVGCDSLVTLNLTITTSPTAVATDNLDATITASAGTTYQWIDCATNLPIAGANAQTYTVTANGSYAVIVNNGTCDDTSDCVVIDYIGIKEVSQDMISVFPNPTRDFVTVNMTAANATIEVVDAQGKILQTSNVENGGTLSLASYETGMYIFRITTENGTSIHRISKN
jgi:hypothetical protein